MLFQVTPTYKRRNTIRLTLSILASLICHIVTIGIQNSSPKQLTAGEPTQPVLAVNLQGESPIKKTPHKPKKISPQNRMPKDRGKSFGRPLADLLPIELPDPEIYSDPSMLEQMPSVINAPELPLPPSKDTPSGTLRIKVFVDEDGQANRIELLETTLLDDYATALINTFKEATFSPGIQGGKPTKSWRTIEFEYTTN